jgi:hypothetical protein
MANMNRCLYCEQEPHSQEHPLPAAFGEFLNAPLLNDRICGRCNTERIGLLDEQYTRCGPEAILRKRFEIGGRAHHEKVNSFYRGSAGGRRLEFLTWDNKFQCEVNVELLGGDKGRQLSELIFREKSGQIHHVPLKPEMTPEQLLIIVAGLKISGEYETRVTFDPPTEQWVPDLIKKAWPASSMSKGVVGSSRFKGGLVKFQVTDRYFRAIAKIGFHYFLTQFPNFTGHEATFSDIRRFIIDESHGIVADRVNKFISARPSPLSVPMSDPNIQPNGWIGHLLCAEIRAGCCLAHYEPFISPHGRLKARSIHLGVCDSAQDNAINAHLYIYYANGKQGRYSGDALEFPSQWLNIKDTQLAPEIALNENAKPDACT